MNLFRNFPLKCLIFQLRRMSGQQQRFMRNFLLHSKVEERGKLRHLSVVVSQMQQKVQFLIITVESKTHLLVFKHLFYAYYNVCCKHKYKLVNFCFILLVIFLKCVLYFTI